MHFESNRYIPRFSVAAGLAALLIGAAGASATVVYSDDFEDADFDNLGFALRDVDAGGDADPLITTWTSANPAFPEVINHVLDPGIAASGIRWHSSRGFTGSGKEKSRPVIINDTPYNISTNPSGLPDSAHINTGLALGIEGVGRSTSSTGFFDPTPTPGVANDQRLTLGLNVGDEVTVSFDWRIWETTPSLNTPALPNLAQLRFGLYQDTDHQLGTVNPFAGPGGLSGATWGQEPGLFRGDLAALGAGANGDSGVFAKLFIGDQNLTLDPVTGEPLFTGDLNRIVEERNDDTNAGGFRFLEGPDSDHVAKPTPGDILDPSSFFPLLQVGTVYNIELSLERTVAAAFQGDVTGLWTATITVKELDSLGAVVATHSYSDEEDGPGAIPDAEVDGIQSDVWDYIGFRNSSGDPEQDFDFIIDNLLIEECAGGCSPALLPGDFNGDGFVGVDDLNIVLINWNQNVTPGDLLAGDGTGEGFVGVDDLNIILVNWNAGTPPADGAAIPEPASLALLGLGTLATLRRRR